MRVAINGFGRIGKQIFKIALEKNLNVVAVNDPNSIESAVYLLQYDSVYGKYEKKVKAEKGNLIVGNKRIKYLSELSPEKLPWKDLKIDVVIESTGIFRDREGASKHLKAGAKKVIITAPAKDHDITIVPGINENKLKKEHQIISVASCTTNSLSPLAKILNEKFGIKKAFFTTVHAYTSSQSIVDSSQNKKEKFRRGRAGAVNVVPTSTGAATAVIEVLPELKGKIDGVAVRVPIPDGSLTDLTTVLEKNVDVNKINKAFKEASKKELKGILEYSEEELVSSDIIGNSHSAVFDSKLTMAEGNLVKVFAWYDNEHGYSSRVIDVVKKLK